MKKLFFVAIAATSLFTSCKKTDTPISTDMNATGKIAVEFDNVVGASDLQLNTGTYTNASNESFKVTTLKYFVSNFSFTKTDGTVITIPQKESYFLIDESIDASHAPEFTLPVGQYKSVCFMVGVDSLRNTKDISERTGVLDPATTAAGMYWSWNSGYIHFKLEGTSSASPQTGNIFQYHIGLFGGYTSPTINNTRIVTLDLSARGIAVVKKDNTSDVHLFADILKVFTGNTNVSIASVSAVHGATNSANIANNYKAMFTHDHTHN
ncbi:MbnP family protein [Ferruginibacter yonginensis]|uniref:MbnP family protein n=1 Tax=Ferruginibacter yonginensis TaxID=1310416 RepID=A0ABV8QT83_9BACT